MHTLGYQPTLPGRRKTPQEALAAWKMELARSLRRHPELIWWNSDTESQRFIPRRAPEGAPTHLETPEAYRGFTFRFDAKGKLLIEIKAPSEEELLKVKLTMPNTQIKAR